jgi:hypothetical protein
MGTKIKRLNRAAAKDALFFSDQNSGSEKNKAQRRRVGIAKRLTQKRSLEAMVLIFMPRGTVDPLDSSLPIIPDSG